MVTDLRCERHGDGTEFASLVRWWALNDALIMEYGILKEAAGQPFGPRSMLGPEI